MRHNCLAAVLCMGLFGGTAQAQEREWVLDVAESDAYLVFGVPNTGDVGVSLWCKLGSGSIQMFSPLSAGSTTATGSIDVAITIDGEPQTRTATVVAESGRSSFEFKMAPDDTLLNALAGTDHFAITVSNHTTTYPMAGADIPAFQKLCTFAQPEPSN